MFTRDYKRPFGHPPMRDIKMGFHTPHRKPPGRIQSFDKAFSPSCRLAEVVDEIATGLSRLRCGNGGEGWRPPCGRQMQVYRVEKTLCNWPVTRQVPLLSRDRNQILRSRTSDLLRILKETVNDLAVEQIAEKGMSAEVIHQPDARLWFRLSAQF